jgi:hypothetical protein
LPKYPVKDLLFRVDHCCYGNSNPTLWDLQGCQCTSVCVQHIWNQEGVILNIICIKNMRSNCSWGCILSVLSSPLLLSSLYSCLDCLHLKNWGAILCISSALHIFCNILCMLEFLWLFSVTWSMLCVSVYQLNWSWTKYCLH